MFKSIYQLPQKLRIFLNQHKFKAFSTANLTALTKFLNYLNNKESKFAQIAIMTNRTGQSLKKALARAGQLRNTSIISKTFVALNSTYINRNQHHNLCHQLNNPLFWSECFKASSNELHEKIAIAHQKWQAHGKYAEYSTPDLIYMYQTIFSGLNAWLLKAKKEFTSKGDKLSVNDFNLYKEFLTQLEAELTREQQIARVSLMARLEIGVKAGDLRYDDVAQATTEELQTLNVLPNDVTIKTQSVHRHLTPKVLKQIRYIINREGTPDEKIQLTSLLKDADHLTVRVNKKGYIFSIPKAVSDSIAKKPPFYTKLPRMFHHFFFDSKMRYEFFQNDICQYLFMSHESLKRLPATETLMLSTLADSTIWQNLQYHSNLLKAEETRIKKLMPKLGIFNISIQKIIAVYEENLKAIGQTITTKQISLVLNLVAALEASKSKLNDQEVKQLMELCELCDSHAVKYQHLSYSVTNLRMRITLLAAPHPTTLIDEEAFHTASTVASKMSAGLTVSDKELSIVECANDALPRSHQFFNDAQIAFVLNKNLSAHNLPLQLQAELKKSPLGMDSNHVITHIKKIKQLVESIYTQIEPAKALALVQKALYEYTHQLLIAISQLPTPAKFNQQTGIINFVMDTLCKLHKSDEVFQKFLQQIAKFSDQYKLFDWHDFLTIYIKPLIKQLNATEWVAPFESYSTTNSATELTGSRVEENPTHQPISH